MRFNVGPQRRQSRGLPAGTGASPPAGGGYAPKSALPHSFVSSENPSSELVHVTEADSLFRRALETLAAGNKLDVEQQAILDAAFLAGADPIVAHPELPSNLAFRKATS
jgi:hypothetical protein